MNDTIPLRCTVADGVINITISREALRFLAENHDQFWDGESGLDVPNIDITDELVFAQEVAHAINYGAEDGSTPLIRMVEAAIADAVENGCGGVAHDD